MKLCNIYFFLNLSFFLFLQNQQKMDSQETEIPALLAEEPLLGPLDIVLILALLAGAAWYLYKNKTKAAAPPAKSYAIQ